MTRKDEILIDGFWQKVLEIPQIAMQKPNIVYVYEDGRVGFKNGDAIEEFVVLSAEQIEEEKQRAAQQEKERLMQPHKRNNKININVKSDVNDDVPKPKSPEKREKAKEPEKIVEYRRERKKPTEPARK